MVDGAAAPARLVRHGQTRRAVLVELPARCFDRRIRRTAGRRGSHDLCDGHVGRTAIVRRHPATHIAFGDDADERKVRRILDR